jgi:hypothetical protein
LDKQQAWKEFKLRFDTTRNSFDHSVEIYQDHQHDLEQLKDIQNELILLQHHLDYLSRIKFTRFSMHTPNDTLFYLDPTIESDLSQLQNKLSIEIQ